MRHEKKLKLRQLRQWRIRKKVIGTAERPRMAVRFSNQNIYVQFIDDASGATVASASTLAKALADKPGIAANVKGAVELGKIAAEAAIGKGISAVVFDRTGARY